MNRRELIQLGGAAVIAAPFLQVGCSSAAADNVARLFFHPDSLPLIKNRAFAPRLVATLERWTNADPSVVRSTIERPLDSGDLLSDLSLSMTATFQQCIVLLVSGTDESANLVQRGLTVLEELPDWDYMRDGESDVLGLMRASKAATLTLLALQVFGDAIDTDRRRTLLAGVADKGCEPCNRTLMQMDSPGSEKGWGVESSYRDRVNVDMSNWPTILGNNNLRAIPTMGLGLGALALEGIDSRSSEWLQRSTGSARTFLGLLEEDGSYFEGISYIDFAFRSLFPFLDAYDRLKGDIDWTEHANFHGVCEYIAALQNGLNADGTPDIINLSDARDTVFTCVPAWIAHRTGDTLAQHASQHFAKPGFYADFLWFDPDRDSAQPDEALQNAHLDLDWIVCRSGWGGDDTVVGFRSGNPTNHEHADRNSIQVKSRGERLLTDPFGASYNPNEPHWLLRLTEGHNAVLIDGQGHQYHNGEQGTSEGLARAEVIDFTDRGEVVHWTSDATHGYKLVNDDVSLVLRSVLFVKPDLVVLVDRISSVQPAEVSIRFHPDNRDGLATLSAEPYSEFSIRRPKAALSCAYDSDVPIRPYTSALALPPELGVYPYMELISTRTNDATVVTAMQISDLDTPVMPAISRAGSGSWNVSSGTIRVTIDDVDGVPSFDVRL